MTCDWAQCSHILSTLALEIRSPLRQRERKNESAKQHGQTHWLSSGLCSIILTQSSHRRLSSHIRARIGRQPHTDRAQTVHPCADPHPTASDLAPTILARILTVLTPSGTAAVSPDSTRCGRSSPHRPTSLRRPAVDAPADQRTHALVRLHLCRLRRLRRCRRRHRRLTSAAASHAISCVMSVAFNTPQARSHSEHGAKPTMQSIEFSTDEHRQVRDRDQVDGRSARAALHS